MELFAVQKAAIEAARNHKFHFGNDGFAWFMEQGLGKTLTAYADFLEHVAERSATRMLVIAPNSFLKGWVRDAEAHGIDLDFYRWQSGEHNYLRAFIKKRFKKPPCIIVNWEAIRPKIKKEPKKRAVIVNNELMNILREYIDTTNTYIVFDESINAKDPDSSQTVGAQLLSYGTAAQRILSGKPITQGPHDLHPQMRLIGQLTDRNYYAFKTLYCKMGGFKGKAVVGAQNEDFLARDIDPHVFRATKKQWTDLPPKLWTIRDYEMTAEMASMYKAMHDDFVLWMNETENVAVDAAITKYIKLAQIQCGWIYDEEKKVRWLVDDAKNPRLNLLKEYVDGLPGKIAIPYKHKPVYEQLLRAFGGPDKVAWIKGQMSGDDLEAQKDRFNNSRDVNIILLQTKASKYGHTLLGLPDLRCENMVFYENTYSLDDRSQIEDRIHRHGQTADSVLYTDLVGTSLDEECVEALQRKEDVFQAVFQRLRVTGLSQER